MTKKILTGIAVVAALGLMATTVLAGPGGREDRRHGWKITRPAQMRIVPRVEKSRFAKPIKRDLNGSAYGSGFRSRTYYDRGFGNCPNSRGRF